MVHLCTEVSAACPVSATTYGYLPNFGIDLALLIIFAICACCQIGFGIYHKAWTFMIALGVGTAMEAIGYGGRLILHNNPWSQAGFDIQICCLIIAPSFIAAGIYLSLKHIVLYTGPEASRIKPRNYTWFFICADISSIFIQAAGGGIAAAANETNVKLIDIGDDLIIAGIAIQVATMSICGLLALDFFIRLRRHGVQNSVAPYQSAKLNGQAPPIDHRRFQLFIIVELVAYVCVLIRTIYRLPEMAGGWGNPLMQEETEFLVLDGLMVVIASILFTVFHPGWWFPPMTTRWQKARSTRDIEKETASSSPERGH